MSSELLAGLDAFPAYYARMAPANLAAPAGPDLSSPRWPTPPSCGAGSRPASGSSTCATGTAFAAGTPGHGELRAGRAFATYLGWLIPSGTPLTLLGRDAGGRRRGPAGARPDRHRPARRGSHRSAGDWTGELARDDPAATFADLPRSAHRPRRGRPRRPAPVGMGRGAHRRRGARPRARAPRPVRGDAGGGAVGALPKWLPCSIAASHARRGRPQRVCVDDDFDNAEKAGIVVVHDAS